jgi:hypothetical protein
MSKEMMFAQWAIVLKWERRGMKEGERRMKGKEEEAQEEEEMPRATSNWSV